MTGQMNAVTIFALSSGHGKSGVAVFRISGPHTSNAVQLIAGSLPAPRRASLRSLRHPHSRKALDRGLVLWLPGPHSFTGEDMAEFHVHGGRAVIAAMLSALGWVSGLRLAEAGEFSRRAFLNGRLDLTEAEGLADLIDAETEAQRRQALRQSSGALSELYEMWRSDLISAMASVEACLDFGDEEDVPADVAMHGASMVSRIRAGVAAHLADGRSGEILRDGLKVVIAGPPNAGKSTLLNALARREAAIVSEEAGTTRDVIEVRLDLGGFPVILMDTAGIREAPGAIEREGVRRALTQAGQADLVLWLYDPVAGPEQLPPPDAPFSDRLFLLAAKSDLRPDAVVSPPALPVSAKSGEGVAALVERLAQEAQKRMCQTEAPVVTRARHRQQLEICLACLDRYLEGSPIELELRAEDLREAAVALGRITGRVDVEDLLDRIFADFCIGK
jgi:tRNA modification GTPase